MRELVVAGLALESWVSSSCTCLNFVHLPAPRCHFPKQSRPPHHAAGWPDLSRRLLPHARQWPGSWSTGLCTCSLKTSCGWDTRTANAAFHRSTPAEFGLNRFPKDWNVTQQCLCAHNPRSQFVQLFFSAYWVSWCSRISFLYWMYILWPQQPAQFQAYITISCCLTRFFNCVS